MEASETAQSHISRWIDEAVASTPVCDLHTHLYPPEFGDLMLWGIDELLTYHYLIGEAIRARGIAYDAFWAMPRERQADFIWQTLFIERAPLSEACRGVLTVLHRLGLDPSSRDLQPFREFFHGKKPEEYLDSVLRLANVRTVVMTNDPFDPGERDVWMRRPRLDPRFKAVLRIDPLLGDWPSMRRRLAELGYDISPGVDAQAMAQIRRFLIEWIEKMNALYVAVSLPATWRYPRDLPDTEVLEEAILPVCRERNLPFAMMIGVTRQANPKLRLAGDSLAKADVSSIERICAANPKNKFMATMLSRENQHELAVAGRLFPNLLVFGCWWYVNNPSLISEITRLRIELLGTSFVPQHSDARVLDQLIYKWDHSRKIIGDVLEEKLADLTAAGWNVTRDQVESAVRDYLSGNFERFLEWSPA